MKYMKNKDEYYMREALKEARFAYDKLEVPVGCVIVKNNEIIARAHNLVETDKSSIAHAEILAIKEACKRLNSWRLDECEIYVTLEPCLMCSGAIINSRIKRLIYGVTQPKFGAHKSKANVFDINFNHKVEVLTDVLAKDSNELLKSFFKKIRN